MKRIILGLVVGLLIGSSVTAIAATNQTVQATFKNINFKVDDRDPVELEFMLHDGASYLPVRKAGEVIGFEVDYQADPELIIYETPETPKGDNEQMQQTITEQEWISLRELAEKHGLEVGQTVDSAGLFRVQKDDVLWFDFDPELLKQGGEATIKSANGFDVRVASQSGATFINLDDLKKAGLID